MKNRFRAVFAAASIVAAGHVSAECPLDLHYELLVDCIAVEWTGGTYPVNHKLREWHQGQAAELKVGEPRAVERDPRLRVSHGSPASSR